MARMCLRIMLNLREFNSIPSSLFSHTITHCKCVCVCAHAGQLLKSVCVWPETGEKQHCVYHTHLHLWQKRKKQQSSVIEQSTISPMSLLNLHEFSSIDLQCTSQAHMPLP